MCHKIYPNNKNGKKLYFLTNHIFNYTENDGNTATRMFIGSKIFDYKEGELIPPYKYHSFSYKFKETPFGLESEHTANIQEVGFSLPIISINSIETTPKETAKVHRNLKCGYHIHPFNITDELIHIPNTSKYRNNKQSIVIPVTFTYESIQFYDGQDVSVSTFIIPTPTFLSDTPQLDALLKTYKKLFTEIYNYYMKA